MATDDLQSFGAWLKLRREAIDLTRKEVAWATGCSISTIRKIEAGERRPSRQVIELLASCLEIPAAEYSAFVRLARESSKRVSPEQLPALPKSAPIPPEPLPLSKSPSPPVGSGAPQRPANDREQLDITAWSIFTTNLPATLTSFVGREDVVEQLRSWLWRVDVRLITLTGPGGVGKTRLSVEVAAGLLDDFADGIFFVSLAPISDPALVISAIAQALGVRESQGRTLADTLSQYLASKNMLLVLDNFEQVLEARQQVSSLLQVARRLKVLITSRVPLHLYGEHEFDVPPLDVPANGASTSRDPAPDIDIPDRYEAVQLFVRRSQAVRPGFTLTHVNAGAVAEICRKLDGLPLALELAAARMKYYSPQAIVALLEKPLDLLTGGAQDLPARHQTLRAALAWSYGLLQESEQALFRRLGVFVGGFSLEAAEGIAKTEWQIENVGSAEKADIAQPIVDTLLALADNSLLRQDEGLGEQRFQMLETIREYAIEELRAHNEEVAVRQQHALYFLAFAEMADAQGHESTQADRLDKVEGEHDNLRAALRWLIELGRQDAESSAMAMRLAVSLAGFWNAHGHVTEGRTWLAEILRGGESDIRDAKDGPGAALRAAVMEIAGKLSWDQGDTAAARTYYKSSLALRQELGDRQGLAKSLNGLGSIDMYEANNHAAREWFEAGLALALEAGDEHLQARILNNLGGLLRNMEHYDMAQHYLEQSVALYRKQEDRAGMAVPLGNLGLLAIDKEEYSAARVYQEEALPICRELGHKNNLAFALTHMGLRAIEERDYSAAREFYMEGLLLAHQLGYKSLLAGCFENIGGMCEALGNPLAAARLWGSASAIREAIAVPLPLPAQPRHERHLTSAQSQVDMSEFKVSWAQGRTLSIEQTLADALALLVDVTRATFGN